MGSSADERSDGGAGSTPGRDALAGGAAPTREGLPGDALYRLLVEHVRDYAIFMVDRGGAVMSWNEGAERITDYDAREVLGRPFSIFYPGDGEREAEGALASARAEGRCEEEGWRLKRDGHRFWATSVLTAIPDETGQPVGFALVVRDLTERKLAAWAYEESRQRYRSLFEHNPDAIFSLDLQGGLTSANPASARTAGRQAEELLGLPLVSLLVPEDAEPVSRAVRGAAAGDAQTLETALVHPDGNQVDLSMTLVPIRVGTEILGIYGIAEDVTLRRLAEQEREVLLARERLARAEAEAASQAKSNFLSIVSHELRTPLNVITGYTEILMEGDVGAVTEAQMRPLDRIRASAGHLLEVINEILAYARMEADQEEVQAERVELVPLLLATASLVEPLAREKDLGFEVDLPRRLAPLHTDPGKVQQILLHLVSNAIRFTTQGSVRLVLRAEADAAVIEVIDTGMGIAPENQERIFEPFWQVEQPMTRKVEGAGLGLSVARRTAELLGGTLTVRSVPGEGSTFTLRLPPRAPHLSSELPTA